MHHGIKLHRNPQTGQHFATHKDDMTLDEITLRLVTRDELTHKINTKIKFGIILCTNKFLIIEQIHPIQTTVLLSNLSPSGHIFNFNMIKTAITKDMECDEFLQLEELYKKTVVLQNHIAKFTNHH